jgi:CheY-like chemotaxis protein
MAEIKVWFSYFWITFYGQLSFVVLVQLRLTGLGTFKLGLYHAVLTFVTHFLGGMVASPQHLIALTFRFILTLEIHMASKILVVEDDLNLLATLKYNLAKEGHEVITAVDGAQALEVARREKPDLLVLDIMLPKMSGFEVCRILRKETNVPILMLTFMAEDPKTITRATRLIWVAHNLERSADRVTNICERVVYMITGKMEELAISKY